LGEGSTVILPGLSLSPGWHTITLRASDSDGQVATASVRIQVGPQVWLPLLLRGH